MAFDDLSPLRAGDTAPDFSLGSAGGEAVTLSELLKTKPVVIAFVPAAFTGRCTGEFCELRDNIAMFDDAAVHLLGISADSKFALQAWAEKEGITFPLLSDFWPHGAVARQYGVFLEEAGLATRATFVIGQDGVIKTAFVNPPSEARPLEAYREALAAL